MRELALGSWITEKEAEIIGKALEKEFGEENVYVEKKAQYIDSTLKFSMMRGIGRDKLLEVASEALDVAEFFGKL